MALVTGGPRWWGGRLRWAGRGGGRGSEGRLADITQHLTSYSGALQHMSCCDS